MQALIDDGLPVLQPYLGSSVIVKGIARAGPPLIHLNPGHALTQAYPGLHGCLIRGQTCLAAD